MTVTHSGTFLYVAGPMSGYPAWNYPAFHAAEAALIEVGFAVLNPARNKVDEPSWDAYMRASLAQVLEADGIVTLPGWQESPGASLEVQVAHALRVPVRPLAQWLLVGAA